MAQRGLGDRHSVMDSHRLEPWSGITLVSTTDLCLEGPAVDGRDDFGSEGMRRSPWVYQTNCMLLSRQRVTQ
jgi:hypothetical protein